MVVSAPAVPQTGPGMVVGVEGPEQSEVRYEVCVKEEPVPAQLHWYEEVSLL